MKNISKICLTFMMVCTCLPVGVFGVQTPNPRGGSSVGTHINNIQNTKRAASTVVNRSASSKTITPRISGNVKPVSVSRSAVNNRDYTSANKSRSAANPNRKTSIFSRAAKSTGAFLARSANNNTKVRSAKSHDTLKHLIRATAIYSDDSRIGGGYSECKNAFATCMDQFCGVANDTYRRCYCSDRFTDFKDTENALDEALGLLADFQNNNLNAVDKTAAEVGAMYSSTAGEAALKKDTSASQKLLNSISDVLSGSSKKKSSTPTPKSSSVSLGVINLSSLSTSLDDIWSGGEDAFNSSNSSMWANNSASTDMTSLEGKALYDDVYKQCSQVVADSCSSESMFNLARSSYSVLIMQDCNAYEKNIAKKKQSVEDTVRTAEKYLREARLEEYRAHNSQDVNDCLSKVEEAIKQSTACGEKYVKCLDYSGMYINPVTGEAVYSKALFGLNSLIVLDGSADILGANPDFNSFLDDKKKYVTQALDTCRSIADDVWTEFKKSAIIQIAQAQDEKIEEVKNSCISTMKECYDSKSGALKDFDTTTAQASGAIAAVTARGMCADKVMTCASLYGEPNACSYDDRSKKITGDKCGLQSLLALVDTVDSVKVAEGCESAIKSYVKELCTPISGDEHEYPWGCRKLQLGVASVYETVEGGEKTKTISAPQGSLYDLLEQRADQFCGKDLLKDAGLNNNITDQSGVIKKIVDDISELLEGMLSEECEKLEGVWIGNALVSNMMSSIVSNSNDNIVTSFYAKVFDGDKNISFGTCAVNTLRSKCLEKNTDAEKSFSKYNEETQTCEFAEEWYNNQCASIGGYYKDAACYVGKK